MTTLADAGSALPLLRSRSAPQSPTSSLVPSRVTVRHTAIAASSRSALADQHRVSVQHSRLILPAMPGRAHIQRSRQPGQLSLIQPKHCFARLSEASGLHRQPAIAATNTPIWC